MTRSEIDEKEIHFMIRAGLGGDPLHIIGKTAVFYPDEGTLPWLKMTFTIQSVVVRETALLLIPSAAAPWITVRHFAFDALEGRWHAIVFGATAPSSSEDLEDVSKIAELMLSAERGRPSPGTFELLP